MPCYNKCEKIINSWIWSIKLLLPSQLNNDQLLIAKLHCRIFKLQPGALFCSKNKTPQLIKRKLRLTTTASFKN